MKRFPCLRGVPYASLFHLMQENEVTPDLPWVHVGPLEALARMDSIWRYGSVSDEHLRKLLDAMPQEVYTTQGYRDLLADLETHSKVCQSAHVST